MEGVGPVNFSATETVITGRGGRRSHSSISLTKILCHFWASIMPDVCRGRVVEGPEWNVLFVTLSTSVQSTKYK